MISEILGATKIFGVMNSVTQEELNDSNQEILFISYSKENSLFIEMLYSICVRTLIKAERRAAT